MPVIALVGWNKLALDILSHGDTAVVNLVALIVWDDSSMCEILGWQRSARWSELY